MRMTDTAKSIFVSGFILAILTLAMAFSESVEPEVCDRVRVTYGHKGEIQNHYACTRGDRVYKKVVVR